MGAQGNAQGNLGHVSGRGRQARPAIGFRALLVLAAVTAGGIVAAQQVLHRHLEERGEPGVLVHWLRDGAMALPVVMVALGIALLPTVTGALRRSLPPDSARTAWALVAALLLGALMVPGNLVHSRLFVEAGSHEHAHEGMGTVEHLARDGASVTLIALGVLLLVGLVWDPWGGRGAAPVPLPVGSTVRRGAHRTVVAASVGALALAALPSPGNAAPAAPAALPGAAGPTCERTLVADVVALDQSFDYNRLGATNPAGMIFALRHDLVLANATGGVAAGTPLNDPAARALNGSQLEGNVALRPDKRPRPLTLRANVGDCLQLQFQNLLGAQRASGEQPADRHVGIHVKGLATVNGVPDDGTYVGRNGSSLAGPGEKRTYTLYAEHEGGFVLDNGAALAAGEASGGTTAFGLFGAVNVEPRGTDSYRSQLTRAEMDMAASAWNPDGTPTDFPQYYSTDPASPHYAEDPALVNTPAVRETDDADPADRQPVLNYDARYPTDPSAPGYDAARAGMPILRTLDGARIVHADLNAIIAGPKADGWRIPAADYPASYWANQVVNEDQRRGEEPFREFTVIFHDEVFALQAFPEKFNDTSLQHTLHGVRDGFGINYGVAGAGAEVIANRLGIGPMADCVECKYEEFFLTAWAVGDPAMVVDSPANKVLAGGPRATYVKFPDDPSNVHHSYLNDRVKFRNLHAGPKEHHIFHLHAHQWQATPNEMKSNYLDSQLIGPGASYTYDIAYGGSGNRNKTVGDSIFHCHFYPHFAQGMWELWRVHDTFERGTRMDADGLRPAEGARALPDGEIERGTPIPALVPLPSMPMAPMPAPGVTVVSTTLPGASQPSAQVSADGDATADVLQGWSNPVAENPGYPFFIGAAAGHRPPTPPLDILDDAGTRRDGGLGRHVIIGGTATSYVTPRDMNKVLEEAQIAYLPEEGTAAERAAMAFHGQLWHDTHAATGDGAVAVTPTSTRTTGGVGRTIKGFETNGLPPAPGAPFADPCRTDGTDGTSVGAIAQTKRYKAAVIQFDAVFNKVGWHFPQQRIEALWDDVSPTLTKARAPEPLVMRLAGGSCAELWHTNLVPNVYELDDYQVRTPTDVIGQHIHLVKFDVTSADGSGNGFNYEDGTLSPQEVEERIHAVRAGTEAGGQPALDVAEQQCTNGSTIDGRSARKGAGDTATPQCPLAVKDPFFGGKPGVGDIAWGARTTVQRWFADPVLNDSWDRGHGSVFTHDHFGPSTHQQTGLYATVLVEPEGSAWKDPETGAALGGRHDGGPTSWRADIITTDAKNAHREFYLEFGDFEHAYLPGAATAPSTADNLAGTQIPSYANPEAVVNPSARTPADNTPDLFSVKPTCPNGTPRPCPEAISADDIGTMLVNYRNEPIAHRIYDPATKKQAAGAPGDLAFAFQSRTDRKIAALNTQPTTYPARKGVLPGDPYTPLLRAYAGDQVRVRMQVGATEEQHNVTIQGMKWKDEPLSPASGWRNSRAAGISEYFVVQSPLLPDAGTGNPSQLDHLWATGAASDDLWNGTWGLLRSYQKPQADLKALPNNVIPSKGWTLSNASDFNTGVGKGTCLANAPVRTYNVTAVRAADVLGAQGIVYNARGATVRAPDPAGGAPVVQGTGTLIDPTGLMYVQDADLVLDPKTGKPTGLKPGTPVEPLVLRANAGDYLKVQLTNKLPAVLPDLPGYNALPPILTKGKDAGGGLLSFNANDVAASSTVGLHADLVSYAARASNGMDVGGESGQGILPGKKATVVWYAGDVHAEPATSSSLKYVARPVEYGAIGLHSADMIKGAHKGLVGALVIEPPGSTWTTDPGTRTTATVTMGGGTSFRELVAVVQDDVNLRYSATCPGVPADMKCAVPAMPSEGKGVPEDAEDSGQKAINYRTDPVWYRMGIAPDTPFEDPLLRDSTEVHRALSNSIVGGQDPSVPILTAALGDQVRLRIVQPGGHPRGHVMALNGHSWQRLPAVPGTTPGSDPSDRLAWSFSSDIGNLPFSPWIGAQDGIGPAINTDMVIPAAGGPFGRLGDYLFRDTASMGGYQGLWALLRVNGG